jgi:prepilin-type N-terminal cleavage/methylation domain-containing protein
MMRSKGFTLLEVVMVLAVVGILSALLVPMMTGYINDSKVERARADVKVIATAIQSFNKSVGEWPVWVSGTLTKKSDSAYDLLAGSKGLEPSVEVGVTFPFDNDGTIDEQLISNVPGYPELGINRVWDGPYLERLKSDPWGNKYYVVVKYLWNEEKNACFVLSSGPDKILSTDFEQSVKTFVIGGDDIVFRIK